MRIISVFLSLVVAAIIINSGSVIGGIVAFCICNGVFFFILGIAKNKAQDSIEEHKFNDRMERHFAGVDESNEKLLKDLEDNGWQREYVELEKIEIKDLSTSPSLVSSKTYCVPDGVTKVICPVNVFDKIEYDKDLNEHSAISAIINGKPVQVWDDAHEADMLRFMVHNVMPGDLVNIEYRGLPKRGFFAATPAIIIFRKKTEQDAPALEAESQAQ